MWDPRTLVIGALCLIVAVMMITTVTWEVQEVETYLTYEPYSYEKSLVRESQVPKWLFLEATQAQYMVKNTDSENGKFVLNFTFDNGEKTKTETKEVEILEGVERAVTVDSPLMVNLQLLSMSFHPINLFLKNVL